MRDNRPIGYNYESWYNEHPNRLPGRPKLGEPVMSEPAASDSNVPAVSPTGAPVLPQVLVVVLTVLAALAGGVAAIGAAGVGLPAWLTGIAAAVSAICAALGVASPGLRSQPKQ